MTMVRTYASAGAFRKALEERLKRESRARQIDINRLRRQVSFDRLLARLFRAESVPWRSFNESSAGHHRTEFGQ